MSTITFYNMKNEQLEVSWQEIKSWTAKPIARVNFAQDNIWNADVVLSVFKIGKNYLLHEEIPDGYSSVTYDPEDNYYFENNLEGLLRYHIDIDRRYVVAAELIKNGYDVNTAEEKSENE